MQPTVTGHESTSLVLLTYRGAMTHRNDRRDGFAPTQSAGRASWRAVAASRTLLAIAAGLL